jgi:hypothetical protein
MEELRAILKQAFTAAEEAGMVWPLILVAVAPNGSICGDRVHNPKTPTDVLVRHLEAGIMKPPLTLFLLDQNNQSLKVTIESLGEPA